MLLRKPIKRGRNKSHLQKKLLLQNQELAVSHQLPAANMAHSILRRWGVYLDKDDITSACHMALCNAAAQFDHTRGTSFSSFVYFYIKGELSQLVKTAVTRSTHEELHCNPQINGFDPNVPIVIPDDTLRQHSIRKSCIDSFRELGELERTVSIEVFLLGKSVSDVARSLRYSRSHISEVKSTATRKLKEMLGDGNYIT